MRKFALYRDLLDQDIGTPLSTCLPLNGPHVYMVYPNGLGMNVSPAIASLDNLFYRKIKKSSFEPETFNGTIYFFDEQKPKNDYIYYRQFVEFCTHAKQLYFGYAPYADDEIETVSEIPVEITTDSITFSSSIDDDLVSFDDTNEALIISDGGDGGEYTLDTTLYKANCEFVSIEKTEIDRYGVLACPVQFTFTTPWYDDHHQEINPEQHQGQAGITIDEIIGDIRGDINGSFEMVADVSSLYFSWNIADANTDEVYFSFNINDYPDVFGHNTEQVHLNSIDGILSYSSKSEDSYFRYLNVNSGITYNLVDHMDIKNDIFKRIPLGRSVRLTVFVGEVGHVNIICKLFDYYRSV